MFFAASAAATLRPSAPKAAASGACPEWKVLVYDSAGSEVIAPLLSVGELRKLGVTLHLRLDQPREPISDVAAVYFVRPTEANVRRIADDLKRRLYRSFHLNFAHKTPRELVELLVELLLDGRERLSAALPRRRARARTPSAIAPGGRHRAQRPRPPGERGDQRRGASYEHRGGCKPKGFQYE